MERPIRLPGGNVIPPGELIWRFSASGGPGGQHANTANTRVELVFDIEASPSLSEGVKARLMARLGTEIRVVSSEQRSQWQNRRVALDRLEAKLAAALAPRRSRVATRPTLASKRRRLDAKSRNAGRKADRRPPRPDE